MWFQMYCFLSSNGACKRKQFKVTHQERCPDLSLVIWQIKKKQAVRLNIHETPTCGGICFIDWERRTIESQVFDFKSTQRANGTFYSLENHSKSGKSDGVPPSEPFSYNATKTKVNSLLERLMECIGALHLEAYMEVELTVWGDIMALKNE